MTDWTSGYVADIGYTYGYYAELNPLSLRLAFLNAGLVPPQVGSACELGFGQGMSANLHAAASVVSWHGTDFNPSQAGFAQELAAASGAQAQLFDQAFEDFCHRNDLPAFDFIGLHGIWSWISDANRAVIVDFIHRKLKVGGVLYVSYNTQPGWAAMVPMRDLLTEHAEVLGADGAGIVSRIDAALGFADQLLAVNPAYARANPQIADRITKIKEQSRNYLAHEYFNRDWNPMSFAQMGHWLQSAKMQWACSANYLDAIDIVNLTTEQRAFLKSIPDPLFQQTTRDFIVNQQFRKDYWVKGARRLTVFEQLELLRGERVVLIQPKDDVSLKVAGSLGEATMQESVYKPILQELSDHRIVTLGELEELIKTNHKDQPITFPQLLEAALLLCANGTLACVQEQAAINRAKKHTDALNHHLIMKSRSSDEIAYLSSPVTAGGIAVSRFHQLFLLGRQKGLEKPSELADFTWDIIERQSQRLIKEGKPLEGAEENRAELTSQASSFCTKQLPILNALCIH
jgi:SAM-dependent methyltransferase